MTTAVTEAQKPNIENPAGGHMKTCLRCGVRYDWRKSSSWSLKMTYCGTMCEIYDTGTTIETLLSTTKA